MHCNIGDKVPNEDDFFGMTKWHARIGAPLKGTTIPLDGAVHYNPIKDIFLWEKQHRALELVYLWVTCCKQEQNMSGE